MTNLKQQFSDYDDGVQKTRTQYSALLGKTKNVVEHPTRNGFCYARMADNLNELITVFNDKVSQVYNLPVLIERRGNNWYVVGRDTARYSDWGSSTSFIPKHAKQHEFNRDEGTGADTVFIYPDQMMPLLVYPSGSSGINSNLMVAPYMLQRNGSFAYVGGTGTQDILMYKPLDDQAILGLVYLDKVSGNPGFIIASGTTFDGSYTGTSQIAPYLPYPSSTDHEPLYFVRLTSGTSSLGWNNLYNARQFVGGMGGSVTTGSSGVSDHESLTGLLGGAPADHYHLTQSQINGLVSGSSTSLHSHPGASLPVFITGSIPFSGADGVLTEDNSKLFWSSDFDSLWIGRQAIPYLQSTVFPLVSTAQAENLGATVAVGYTYGTGTLGSPSPSFNAYRSRGTYENPTPVQAGDALGTMIGAGYGGTDFVNATRQRFYANSNWVTGSNYESRIEWEVTPSGSATRRVGMTLYGDNVNIPTGTTYNIGGVPHTHSSTGREILTSARTYYVRKDLGAATVSIASPGVVSKVGHGLAIGDAVVFSILPKMATCTITIASPGVVTKVGHGYAANQPIIFHTTGALPTGITKNVTYYVIATGLATDTFRFSTSVGGAAVNTSGTQSGTHYVESTGALPTGLTAGTVYYVISAGFGVDAFQVSTSVGGAAVNTSGTQSGIFNIATGDDTNTGLTDDIAGALLTTAKAMSIITSTLDTAGYQITIQMADSKYLTGIVLSEMIGFGILKPIIQGNLTTPSNVVIDDASAIIGNTLSTVWQTNGFRLQSSSGAFCYNIANAWVECGNAIEFGTAGYHFYSFRGTLFMNAVTYVIYKAAAYHLYADLGTMIMHYGNTAHILDAPAFTTFAIAVIMSTIYVGGNTWTGTATGKRYVSNDNSLIGTAGQATTWLPGNVAGTTAGDGQYT